MVDFIIAPWLYERLCARTDPRPMPQTVLGLYYPGRIAECEVGLMVKIHQIQTGAGFVHWGW